MSELEFVRVERQEHIAELAEFAGGIFREYFSALHTPEKVEYLVDYLLSVDTLTCSIVNEGYEYCFVDASSEHVGFLAVQARSNYLYLSKLYLAGSLRGKGYGRQEFEFVKKRAAELGFEKIRLHVARDNESSISKYKHMGFAIIDEVDNEVGNGIQMNDYVMEFQMENPVC